MEQPKLGDTILLYEADLDIYVCGELLSPLEEDTEVLIQTKHQVQRLGEFINSNGLAGINTSKYTFVVDLQAESGTISVRNMYKNEDGDNIMVMAMYRSTGPNIEDQNGNKYEYKQLFIF